jgi:two-component system alkaline phosphatase synthesis response regulator PhoP
MPEERMDHLQDATEPELELPKKEHKGIRPRVLVIDDDTSFLELADVALTEQGLDVRLAADARSGLMEALREPPDVILLDIMLPGEDGIDLLEALRAEPETHDIPVVACTALGERESGALLPTVGFDGVVPKPLDLRELGRALLAHLRAKSSE